MKIVEELTDFGDVVEYFVVAVAMLVEWPGCHLERFVGAMVGAGVVLGVLRVCLYLAETTVLLQRLLIDFALVQVN